MYVSRRKLKSEFFTQINKLINWNEVEVLIIERTAGSIKRWFNAATARYIGLAKTHTQHLMEAIAYNLYRSPNIVAKNTILIK